MPARTPSSGHIAFLVCLMLVTGCSNSLWSKYQDMQCVANCDSPDPARRKAFEMPVYQSLTMFLGELLCLIAALIMHSRLNPFRPHSRPFVQPAERKPANAGPPAPRLGELPHSRPDDSAIFFNSSDISLHTDAATSFDSAGESAEGALAKGRELQGWKKASLFWLPSLCDICGTTAMNVGLFFVPVSIYQMVRGALVLWVGFFSVIFLGRKLNRAQWAALGTVMIGVAVVGLSSVGAKQETAGVEEEPKAGTALAGVLLILFAQIFTASQFVIEEKIMGKFSVEPLLAVGYEGFFGTITTSVAIIVLHLLIGRTPAGRGGYFDAPEGFHQIVDNPAVWHSSIIIMFSIAFFNFAGLAVTKSVSATARSTIDTSRTVGIWMVSLALGWETFRWLQVLGFALLVYGTFVFNGILDFPAFTGLQAKAAEIPAIYISDEEDEIEEDSETTGRARSVEARPAVRRSGSGRRGEVSPLLRNESD